MKVVEILHYHIHIYYFDCTGYFECTFNFENFFPIFQCIYIITCVFRGLWPYNYTVLIPHVIVVCTRLPTICMGNTTDGAWWYYAPTPSPWHARRLRVQPAKIQCSSRAGLGEMFFFFFFLGLSSMLLRPHAHNTQVVCKTSVCIIYGIWRNSRNKRKVPSVTYYTYIHLT